MSESNTFRITRRHFLGTVAGGIALMAAGPSFAQSKTLQVLSHRVHQTSLGEGDKDLLAAWKQEHDTDVVFTTLDSNPLMDRLFREASLAQTDFSVGYMVDNRPTSDNAKLFESLQEYQDKDPIEAFDDIAAGLVRGMTIDGRLIGIPVRTATQGLFYNEELLAEAGFDAPPTTLEELVAQTIAISEHGKATGMILASDLAVFPVMFARAFGGDFINGDFELLPDPAAMQTALTVMADMFQKGALPRSYATNKGEELLTWMQQGRAAFSVLPFARAAQLNDPAVSNYAGKIKAIGFPISETLKGKVEMSAVVEAWAMTIPANAVDKDLAWQFIKEVSSKKNTLGMALNGNGPARVSTFLEPELTAKNALAEIESQVLANARGAFPPFAEAARAQQIFIEEVQLAVLGRKSPQDAVASMQARIQPLLPA
ncbi:transcriptional antiterminator [Devosia epidermidihirudinis]|uniref:Transcriptional antiterminator n=1 Tax=Devosia epidermidihirudinis TaxID=1293439 RepID=A0A0F5QBM0_9HYPH|nr:extracellular solute-binding protein [Devosia epidermidihirudinis]KKC37404.1 transcriptional antiterminator [Devosia epidermidihirudinis]